MKKNKVFGRHQEKTISYDSGLYVTLPFHKRPPYSLQHRTKASYLLFIEPYAQIQQINFTSFNSLGFSISRPLDNYLMPLKKPLKNAAAHIGKTAAMNAADHVF
ncbi:MAG: hypothetical protein ACUVQV_00955 [Dissulfurimicrobium sp.]|uniref:hypothetical protein n=1 Tax=Dissulfurimicrobium sp. TaxID=2022436 RepID=UPI004049308E